jgi:hypothetical protein
MQAVLGEQDMGEELRASAPAGDWMRGGGRLGDRFAGPAGELLPNVLNHLPSPRDQLRPRRSCARSSRHSTGRPKVLPLARQMLGQRPPRRFAPFEGLHRNLLTRRRSRGHLRRRLGLRRILLQIGELKLKLIEQHPAFRGLPEPLVPQLPDRVLELLDQERTVLRLALCRRLAGRGGRRPASWVASRCP